MACWEHLCALGLVHYECERCFDTEPDEDEFVVILRTSSDQAASVESWRRAAEAIAASHPAPQAVLALTAELARVTQALQESAHRHADDMARLEQRFLAVERRTAPLAWLARRLLYRVRGTGP